MAKEIVGLGPMRRYAAFYRGQQKVVEAQTSLLAYQKAVATFKPPKRQRHMVHVHVMNDQDEVMVHPNDF